MNARGSTTRFTVLRRMTLLAVVAIAVPGRAGEMTFPGLGDAGTPTGLSIYAGRTDQAAAEKLLEIVGPDVRAQLVVTAHFDSGQQRDFSRHVAYEAVPPGVVQVNLNGLIKPLANGQATITATGSADLSTSVTVEVRHFENPPPVNFPNEIAPIFTKLGCNSGGCHGKSGGQNGFRLSLLGFEPENDFEYLVNESRGRRLFPAAPDHSLLLLKGTGRLPHGGGARIEVASPDHRMIRRWISQGMPYGSESDPAVSSISVYPAHQSLPIDGRQQLLVVAHYSDGSTRDVTRTARYESNDNSLAEVDHTGLVQATGRPGEVAVMIRYQTQVAVFGATIPLGMVIDELPQPANFIDELVFVKLKELGMPPSEQVDDAAFIRRVSLDITGQLPDAESTRRYLADADPAKRDKWIEKLLESEAYADYFARKWSAILRNKRRGDRYRRGNYAFHDWIRSSLLTNKPYDKFVGEIITATGELGTNPPVVWYRSVAAINEQVEDTTQLFLGLRIQCARCHHHPFEKWSQQDYAGMSAFFSRVGNKPGFEPTEQRVVHNRGVAEAKHPKSGIMVKPTALDGEPLSIPVDDDPRRALAAWMAAPDNPFFARALVNRYWKHFFGRGLVDPEDDMRQTNPPSNPQLLDALSSYFVESGFDLKQLVRTICHSRTYQLSSLPNDYNGSDRQSFARHYPRRLEAEVLLDAIDQINATHTDFTGLPKGTRAVQIPDFEGVKSYFLNVFGEPTGNSASERERSGEASLAQSLHLINSQGIHTKLASGRAKAYAADTERETGEKITEFYLLALCRPPEAAELQVALAHVEKQDAESKQVAYEDLIWAVINTKEFLFNH